MRKLDETEKEDIRNMIVDKLGLDRDELKDDYYLQNLGADSLDEVEIVMELETMFKIVISDSDAEDLETVENAFEIVERYL